jgi:hypothetical protein
MPIDKLTGRVEPARKAKGLLETLRQTPMRRGGRVSKRGRLLRRRISDAIEAQDVLTLLARRIAFQLVLKVDVAELGDRATWDAIGQRWRREIERLKNGIRLVDRQIIVALPKLSADHIEKLLHDLRAADPQIARTILNVALDAADPVAAAHRYLAEYHRVAEHVKTTDAGVARTLANATFMAHAPARKAARHFKQFADLEREFHGDVGFARTVARAACRAPDPTKVAQGFVAGYQAIVADLTSKGTQPHIARTLAAIASVGADPMPTAAKLLEKFEDVLRLAKKTHPTVARSIALSACRAADPLSVARLYMKNYDVIVRVISRTDAGRTRRVASQAFRSHEPLRWARRYLGQLKKRSLAGTS